MLLDIYFQPNYKDMWLRKQTIINYNNKRENKKRVQHNYEVVVLRIRFVVPSVGMQMTLRCLYFFVKCLLIFSQSLLRVLCDDERHRIQYWDPRIQYWGASEPREDIRTDIRTPGTLRDHGRHPDIHLDV